jgi:hypothetical protein
MLDGLYTSTGGAKKSAGANTKSRQEAIRRATATNDVYYASTSKPQVTTTNTKQGHGGFQKGSQASHQSYINDKMGGMDTYISTQQQKYDQALANGDQDMLRRLSDDMSRVGYALNTPTKKATTTNRPTTTPTKQTNATSNGFMDDLRGAYDASVDSQKADLQKLRDNQLADLEKMYVDAVSQGQMSLQEAQQQFQQRSEAINQNVYQNAEVTNAMASQRGLGNSQQMAGMMASDQSRANTIRNNSMTERDQRVNSVRDRIRTLTEKRDIEGNRINAEHDAGVLKAKSTADMSYLNQQFQVGHEDYRANRDFGFQNQLMDKQQGFDLDKMSANHEYALDQMKQGQSYDLEKMGVNQRYDLEKMSTSQQYNMQTLAQQHKNSISSMIKEYGLRDSLASSQAQRDLDNYIAKREADVMNQLTEYQASRKRELDKYTPGTPEYKIVQGQMQNEIGQMLAMQEAKTIKDLQIQGIIQNADLSVPGTQRPQPGMFSGAIDPKEEAQYKAKIDSYNRYAEMMGYDPVEYQPFDYGVYGSQQKDSIDRRLNQPGW